MATATERELEARKVIREREEAREQAEREEQAARQVIRDAEERRTRELEDARLAKRDDDRTVVAPAHFHATIYTYREKDANANGSMKDSTHHEVLGLSPDSCIRKALNRAESFQVLYHVGQLSECTDPTHRGRELRD